MFTWRVLIIAASTIFAGAWVLQRIELVYDGPALARGVLPPLAIVLLPALLAIGLLNTRWLRLGKGELLAVYLMVAAGLPLASTGLVHYLLPGLVTGFYSSFADEAGRYQPFFQHIPAWMVPDRAQPEAFSGFFEGGGSVPWGAWIWPLLSWSVLVGAFCATAFGLAGLLKKRWVEEERLRFPLTELPLELMERSGSFLRDRSMWLGAALPALIYGVNGIYHYFLVPGEIPLNFDLSTVLLDQPWRAMAPFTSRFIFYVSPLLIGLVYLMSLEVAFSTWFFFLLTRAQLLFAELVGRTDDHGAFIGLGGQWHEWPNFFPHLHAQARGGLLGVGLLSLWAGRRTFKGLLHITPDNTGAVRSSLGLIGGFLSLVAWGWAAGLSPGLSLAYFFLTLVTLVGVLRLRLDGGLPVVGLHFMVANLLYWVAGTGPGIFTGGEYVAFAFLSVLTYSSLATVAMVQFEGLKMAEVLGVGGRRIGGLVGVGVGLGLLAGYWSTLELVYQHGIFALDQQGGARSVARMGRYFHYLYADAGTRSGPMDWDRLGGMGFGFAVVCGLSWLRLFFLRFPLHPLGFVYGTGLGTLLWGSALVGWGIKTLVVRYGGAGTYRQLRPFFLGMILGELVLRLVWAFCAVLGEPGGGYDWW